MSRGTRVSPLHLLYCYPSPYLCLPLLSLSRRDEEIYSSGGRNRTNGSNILERIRTRKDKLAGGGKHDARLGRLAQFKKKGWGNLFIWAQREKNLFKLWWNKIEEVKRKKNGRKNGAYRGQSVQYRSLWKQGNISESKATSKWQWARITLHAGFTKISLPKNDMPRDEVTFSPFSRAFFKLLDYL